MGLAFSESGDPSGMPVLFLHGFMGSATDWSEFVSALADYRCIAIDLPGHGNGSSRELKGRWDIESTAKACIQVLDHLSIERCILVGYSMGGRLGLYLALNYPQRFQGAVLESASPGLRKATEREERIQLDESRASKIEKVGMSSFLQEWYSMPLFAQTLSQEQIAELVERRKDNLPSSLARSLREMGTGRQPSLWHKLSDDNVPLFLFVGEKDGKFREIAGQMKQNVKIDVIILPGCGHNCHFENPTLYCKHLSEVLENIAS